MVDRDNRGVFRLCSKVCRSAVDSSIKGLRIMYGSAMPEQRPPEPAFHVENSLRGLLHRGCKPNSLSLRLDEDDTEREAKGWVQQGGEGREGCTNGVGGWVGNCFHFWGIHSCPCIRAYSMTFSGYVLCSNQCHRLCRGTLVANRSDMVGF